MRLVEAIARHPDVRIFAVLDSDSDDKSDWDVEPIEGLILSESESADFFIVKAKNVIAHGAVVDCYIDMCLPERISDYAYFFHGNEVDVRYHHECDGEIICAVPIDCFGIYDLYYSRTAPHIGIEILKEGLDVAPHKTYIAEDLGYIFRDEKRFAEAAEVFQIAVDWEPSSHFIYDELATCYDEVGQADKARKYREMFENAN